MKVINIHERTLSCSAAQVGALLATLASPDDRLWPRDMWPPMAFDRPLGVGATGGHGPVRYFVEAYAPGASIRFRFTGPAGFDGFHGYEVVTSPASESVTLRHVLDMQARGWARLTWPLFFRPMHDALIEDSLACAELALGQPPTIHPWSLWVRSLRWLMSGGRARAQRFPSPTATADVSS